jgi:hypothetical protein
MYGSIVTVFLVALDRQCKQFKRCAYLEAVKILKRKTPSGLFLLSKVSTVVVMQLRHPGVYVCSH